MVKALERTIAALKEVVAERAAAGGGDERMRRAQLEAAKDELARVRGGGL